MTSAPTDTAWDFGPVYNLINSLSYNPNAEGFADDASRSKPTDHDLRSNGGGFSSTTGTQDFSVFDSIDDGNNNHAKGGVSLGDFSKIWDHLGVQHDLPPPKIPTFEASTSAAVGDTSVSYTSDGAIYYPASSKTVKWKQDYDAGTETAADADEESETGEGGKALTKNQKRKLRRRKNKTQAMPDREVGIVEAMVLEKQGAWSGSGSDVEDVLITPKKRPQANPSTPKTAPPQARKTIGYQSDHTPSKSHFTPRSHNKKKNANESHKDDSNIGVKRNVHHNGNTKNAGNNSTNGQKYETTVVPAVHLHEQLQKQYTATANRNSALAFKPTQVLRTLGSPSATPSKAENHTPQDNLQHVPTIKTTKPLNGNRSYDLAPLQPRDDLNWALFKKLLDDFPGDRTHLVSALQLSINRPTPSGIHVFVDASNILIGFEENLKTARGIPIETRLPRHPELHFHALALLLERRRPVSKRVLAGSAPEVPAFEQAREVGYETCILDKVWKARELTERQRYFAVRDLKLLSGGYKSGNESSGDAHSYDEATAAALMPRPKWVEQAVDEILHLKMLESIVDTQIPSGDAVPVMVLATGDAAQAEYSSGFLRMVMRALNAGWRVELVAWARQISGEYRKLARKGAWTDKFTIVELDDYCEELFG